MEAGLPAASKDEQRPIPTCRLPDRATKIPITCAQCSTARHSRKCRELTQHNDYIASRAQPCSTASTRLRQAPIPPNRRRRLEAWPGAETACSPPDLHALTVLQAPLDGELHHGAVGLTTTLPNTKEKTGTLTDSPTRPRTAFSLKGAKSRP